MDPPNATTTSPPPQLTGLSKFYSIAKERQRARVDEIEDAKNIMLSMMMEYKPSERRWAVKREYEDIHITKHGKSATEFYATIPPPRQGIHIPDDEEYVELPSSPLLDTTTPFDPIAYEHTFISPTITTLDDNPMSSSPVKHKNKDTTINLPPFNKHVQRAQYTLPGEASEWSKKTCKELSTSINAAFKSLNHHVRVPFSTEQKLQRCEERVFTRAENWEGFIKKEEEGDGGGEGEEEEEDSSISKKQLLKLAREIHREMQKKEDDLVGLAGSEDMSIKDVMYLLENQEFTLRNITTASMGRKKFIGDERG